MRHVREIDLWLADSGAVDDARWPEYDQWLSDGERVRGQRFVTEPLRRQYRLARALQRHVLSHYVPGTERSDWRFGADRFGRPVVTAPPGRSVPSFSLSHSGGQIGIAVVPGGAVGLDLEQDRGWRDGLTVARSAFARAEIDRLEQTEASGRSRTFLQIWTLKEAYAKALGLGLALPFDSFAFAPPGQGHRQDGWRFFSFQLAGTCVGALAVAVDRDDVVKLTARRIVPPDEPELLELHLQEQFLLHPAPLPGP